MKNFAVIISAFYALSMSADLWAQTRGPRYNPPGGGGSSSSGSSRPSSSGSSGSSSRPSSSGSSSSSSRPSSSGSSSSSSPSRGSNYNPPSSGSSSSSSSSSSASRGSNYNPPSSGSSSSSPSRGSNYNPPSSGSSSSGSVSTPSVPRGPRYNPPTSNAPRGPRYNPPVVHTPTTPVLVGTTVYQYTSPREYYTQYNNYIYINWIQYPVQYWYTDGYWDMGGYPYYVHRGYRYRYHPVEMCQYELVDAENYSTLKVYPLQACTTAYDQCAVERDTMNRTVGMDRYFCAEAVDKDQTVAATDYQASSMPEAKKAAIAAYLDDMSFKDIFVDAFNNGVGTCTITNVGGVFGNRSPYNCKFQVNVGDKAYPAVNGSVCSDDSAAAAVDCNVGNEKENAGCIMKLAIESGYCH